MMPDGQMLYQLENEEVPSHVVGSQGRRGVLPSDNGRPSATLDKAAKTPQRDGDGKFPCEYCIKTYLHAKHLKRHMLRRKSLTPA